MEIIYRVYEVESEEAGFGRFIRRNKILDQTVCCCNSREHFKEIMRDMYAPQKINFRNSKNLKEGDIYIVIISEDCYNANQYIELDEFVCSCCGRHFKANARDTLRVDIDYLSSICPQRLKEEEEQLLSMNFCSWKCQKHIQKKLESSYRDYTRENNLVSDNVGVYREDFSISKGYIYMITKRSTKEFYVGQTKYAPIFRWGQHLKTERFPIEHIEDYIFEVLEVCKNDCEVLNEREAYWINKKRDENPSLSLNIQIPKEKIPDLFDLLKEE